MKRIHYPRTTVSQRKLLFETWEATKDVAKACRQARVSERTFYYWKPRFEAGGYEALERFGDHRPQNPSRVSPAIEQKVIELRREHPSWGKRRIADELAKKNNWTPLVSPNTVKRILQDADLWVVPETSAKKGGRPPSVAPPNSQASR
jgi:transposase